MQTVTLDEAREQLEELIDKALQGGEVFIAAKDKPAVRLVPAVRSGFGCVRGQIRMAEDFDAPLEEVDLDRAADRV